MYGTSFIQLPVLKIKRAVEITIRYYEKELENDYKNYFTERLEHLDYILLLCDIALKEDIKTINVSANDYSLIHDEYDIKEDIIVQ